MNTFDYIVVGGGSAGCVLANRLTASGQYRVLLLEAGGTNERFWVTMPIGYGKCFHDPDVNWMYTTEPEASLAGRRGYWPRGKLLGGSGTINAMVFVRGQPADFDAWEAEGNPGWGWRSVLPYFRKLEDSSREPGEWRRRGGPLAVTDVSAQAHPLCDIFLRAGAEAGLPRCEDFNGATPEGVGHYEITVRGGCRVSTATAYLEPARARANLSVEIDALATRLVFDGADDGADGGGAGAGPDRSRNRGSGSGRARGRRATAVDYVQRGQTHRAFATREIVLCAGAINTPQLLQLSGVGPRGRLQALGISVVHDSPAVGEHLQDHLCIDYLYRARVPSLNELLRPWHGKLRVGLHWLLARGGPLALSVNQAGGFVRSRPGLDRPDMQLYFSPLSYTRAPVGKRPLMSPDPFPGFLLSAQPCRPASRGRVSLRSADPFEAPRIEPNSLAAEHDLDDLVAGAQLLRKLAAMPSLAAAIDAEMAPGPQVQTREQMMEDIRQRASSVFHPVGTCRMGPDPRDAVVDARLRAHGLRGLRIVDASVFPAVTSGNTNAPTIMVAEKGADLVLEDAEAG